MSSPKKFLKSQKVLRLATIDDKGVPHIVPVWYWYNKKIYIGSYTRTKKVRNIKKNPNVSFCVDVGVHSPDIYGVMGTGKAKLILDEKIVKKIAKKILLRYFDSMTKSAKELLDDTDCIIEIVPKKVTFWQY